MKRKRDKAHPGISAPPTIVPLSSLDYGRLVLNISGLLEQARRMSARSINSILTATYWEIGRRIMEYEQHGQERAPYGERLLAQLSQDLTAKHGRGFSERNLEQMRTFYLEWEISQTPSAKLEARVKCPTLSGKFGRKKQQTLSAESVRAFVPMVPLRDAIGCNELQCNISKSIITKRLALQPNRWS